MRQAGRGRMGALSKAVAQEAGQGKEGHDGQAGIGSLLAGENALHPVPLASAPKAAPPSARAAPRVQASLPRPMLT